MQQSKSTNALGIIFLGLSTVSTIVGLVSGFLYSWKTSAENFAMYVQKVEEIRAYQQILRVEVKDNAEKKMDKSIAWQQLNIINARLDKLT